MVSLTGVLKSAVAVKALEIARREAAKPENQRKARELLERAMSRRQRGPNR
jgi:hypothetical protein